MAMDISGSFQFPSKDKDWVTKVLIGGVINLIPVVNLIASGYILTLMARSIEREQEELPKWDDWGGYFMKGLMVAVITLVYCIIPLGVMMIGLVPMIAGAAMERGGGAALAGVGVLMIIIGALLFIPILLILPMAILVYAKTGEFGAAFAFGDIISKIKVNLGDYIIILVVALVAGAVLGFVAGLIPVLGFLVSILGSFYLGLVIAHMYGNYFRGAFGSGVVDAVAVYAPAESAAPAAVPAAPADSPAPPQPGA